MLVNLNAVITIHCRTFFTPYIISFISPPPPSVSPPQCACMCVLICVLMQCLVRSEQTGRRVNECKRRTRNRGRSTCGSSSIYDLLYVAIINIWSPIVYPLWHAHYWIQIGCVCGNKLALFSRANVQMRLEYISELWTGMSSWWKWWKWVFFLSSRTFMRPLSWDVNQLECFISVLCFDLPVTPPHAVHCDSHPVWGHERGAVNSASLT